MRTLADFMAASEQVRRTLVRSCKYQPVARILQHDDAKLAIGRYLRGDADAGYLREQVESLRDRMADTPFEADTNQHNADYIERFAEVSAAIELPDVERLPPGDRQPLMVGGMRVTVELHLMLERTTRNNRRRLGAAALRYAKRKPLPPAVGEWQSAFLLGYLARTTHDPDATPENGLCLTIDAHSGVVYQAPTDSARRFASMEAACTSIAERWANIAPPPNARL
ncbi:hypothetical protein D3218_01610 [Aureimonas flava]|uniref:Uncharacterized protein n=2 Tax=Aureimonas flava TaxID=2320271 RepID=A0A3A1WWT7_9HYPH|nr:hypothetical protein D3218_01610 [Aureimonas flava]